MDKTHPMNKTGEQTERIEELEREVAALRAALRIEWEAGHAEHCRRDPCALGEDCRYPRPPELLRGQT